MGQNSILIGKNSVEPSLKDRVSEKASCCKGKKKNIKLTPMTILPNLDVTDLQVKGTSRERHRDRKN